MRRIRAARAPDARRRLAFEPLEPREMLAADLGVDWSSSWDWEVPAIDDWSWTFDDSWSPDQGGDTSWDESWWVGDVPSDPPATDGYDWTIDVGGFDAGGFDWTVDFSGYDAGDYDWTTDVGGGDVGRAVDAEPADAEPSSSNENGDVVQPPTETEEVFAASGDTDETEATDPFPMHTEDAPEHDAPEQYAPVDENPVDVAPADETPVVIDDTSADDVPADDTPIDETPVAVDDTAVDAGTLDDEPVVGIPPNGGCADDVPDSPATDVRLDPVVPEPPVVVVEVKACDGPLPVAEFDGGPDVPNEIVDDIADITELVVVDEIVPIHETGVVQVIDPMPFDPRPASTEVTRSTTVDVQVVASVEPTEQPTTVTSTVAPFVTDSPPSPAGSAVAMPRPAAGVSYGSWAAFSLPTFLRAGDAADAAPPAGQTGPGRPRIRLPFRPIV